MMNSCTNWQKLARLPAKVGFLARPGIPRGRLDWPTEGRFPRAGRGSATAATGAIARGDACIREKNCSTLDADTGAHRGSRGALRWPRTHDFVRLADMPTLRPVRSEEHTSDLQSLLCHSYVVFCLQHKQH